MTFTEAGSAMQAGGSGESSELFFYEKKQRSPTTADDLFREVLEAAETAEVSQGRFLDKILCEIALDRGNFFKGREVEDETLYELYLKMQEFLAEKEEASQQLGAVALVNTPEE